MYRAVLVPVGTKNHPTVESEKGRIGRENGCASSSSVVSSFVAPQPRPTSVPPPERILGRCNRIFRRWLIRLCLRCHRRCVG
ncbi:hypothetical protein [Oryza sativa Japonica Group]|uniref:Uncharacterized protein n=1 Tax=Oryza sativa subsp. japonica TaxID=39947 RepID=Q5N956_ORYSJ|nr:hypothetical protein [Oryza sativa Japonica Group]